MKPKNIEFKTIGQDRVLQSILPYIKGKKVLDIGCVEHNLINKNKRRIWAHDFIVNNSKYSVGIDIQKEDISVLKMQGYNVHYMNAENYKLDEKFDVIFAGELIEHLSNPGLFLRQSYKHLTKKGVIIITTPNAFSLCRLAISLMLLNNNPPVNDEHTCWYSPKVLTELLNRYSFTVRLIKFVDYPDLKPPWYQRVFNLLCIISTQLRETMIIIASKNEK